MSLLRAWFAIPLWKRVLAALALGLLFAALWPEATPYVQFIGDLFVRAIRMLVVPIVLVTIAAGITMLGDPKRIGGIGGKTIGLFAFTTAIAVVKANRPIVLPPIPPIRFGSPSIVIPAAIVTRTIGTTSIRIARTNRSPMNWT